ncbi:MAG TPA: hypothetical protein VGU74_14495 [Gemmatimonadales bacterium]|nr:hypothetical protein [Gemmatimonadales bacterium]
MRRVPLMAGALVLALSGGGCQRRAGCDARRASLITYLLSNDKPT